MKTSKLLPVVSLLLVVSMLAACAPKAAPTAAPAQSSGAAYTFDGTGVAQGYKGTVVSSVPADLVAACKKEGTITIIATPDNWANYGEIFADFEATTGAAINSLNPNGGSKDELAAIEANKDNKDNREVCSSKPWG